VSISLLDPVSALEIIVPVSLLGGVLGLDMVGFPQIMISRPIISATLAGAFLGAPSAGLLIGAVLELIALETLPFGASRYAEWGSAGTVGGAVFALQPPAAPGGLPVAVLAALAAALLSSRSMVILRRAIGRFAMARRDAINAGSERDITAIQVWGLGMDVLRGALVTALALAVFLPLSQLLVAHWRGDVIHSRAFVIAIAATVAAGAVWKIFHTTQKTAWYFLAGLVCGAGVLFSSS